MPLTISYLEGNGQADDRLAIQVQLPDGNGGNANVGGAVQAVGQSVQTVSATLALPAAPGSGSIFFNIQVDVTSGAATLQQSTSAPPAAINGNNRIVYSQTLTPATTDPALDAGVTPDPAVGSP